MGEKSHVFINVILNLIALITNQFHIMEAKNHVYINIVIQFYIKY